MDEYQFDKGTRQKLVAYLRERDFGSSGIRKAELVALAEKARELQVPVLEDDDTLTCETSFRTVGKQRIVVADNYTENLIDLPPMELADVFSNLLCFCHWSTSRLKCRRNDDGFKLFDQRHIDKVKIL